MTKYASKTKVPVDRTRTQIERLLERYGATSFMYGWETTVAFVGFTFDKWNVQLRIPMPAKEDFAYSPTGQYRADSTIDNMYKQAVRQRWRALLLVIQAKLEAVECEITTFEDEFMSHLVLPDGRTVGAHVLPILEAVLESGEMPPALISGE